MRFSLVLFPAFCFLLSRMPATQQILGIRFFDGTVVEAVDQILARRGLVVAPSGTCFRRLTEDAVYRTAITQADLALPDSGFMVLLWRLLRGRRVARISGLAYLQELLRRRELRGSGAVLWILPNVEAREKTLPWLQSHGFATKADDCYIAPVYGSRVEDPSLAERINMHQPGQVIIALSGGVQEKLGLSLRENASYRPVLHCIGAALGFITGYQIAIPDWADRFYLGWFLRLLSSPRRFLPRALNAFALPRLILKYGENAPPLQT
jgi:UDP-N-acetyl-D-mannosaminuronic acid transferase (WecB/TagA/CpsF family)